MFEADDGAVTQVTYKELLARVSQFANALKAQGVKKGDRVIVYMPMTVEGVVAMVANGLGLSVVPNRGVANEFPSTIRVLPFGDPPIMRRLGLLLPRDNPRSHLSHALLDALREVSAPREKKYA